MEPIKPTAMHKKHAKRLHAVLARGHHNLRVNPQGQTVPVRHVQIRTISPFHHLKHLVQQDDGRAVLHTLPNARPQGRGALGHFFQGEGVGRVEFIGEQVSDLSGVDDDAGVGELGENGGFGEGPQVLLGQHAVEHVPEGDDDFGTVQAEGHALVGSD
jgi:hypothetical protein